MVRNLNKFFIVAIVAIAALLQSSEGKTVHVVGDALGWIVPPSADAYTTWAANQTFKVGDVVVFNFATGRHDVAQVTESALNACNGSSPILRETNGPLNITLSSSGQFYYICTVPGHCSGGQKLIINVTAAASSPAPQPSTAPSPINTPTPAPLTAPTPSPAAAPTQTPTSAPTPSLATAPTPTPTPTSAPTPSLATAPTPTPTPTSAPTPSTTRAPATYIVGDEMGWTVPPNTSVSYPNWAQGKSFIVGDTLVFNYRLGVHDVAEVSKQAYGSCDSNTTISLNSNPPARITLTTPGEHFYICTFAGHCTAGQQLAINVTGTSTATSLSPSSPTAGATPSDQPGNSAKSIKSAGFSITFLAIIVVGLLY